MRLIVSTLFVLVTIGLSLPAVALDTAAMVKILETLDDRQRNAGDYKTLTYIEQKEKGEERPAV